MESANGGFICEKEIGLEAESNYDQYFAHCCCHLIYDYKIIHLLDTHNQDDAIMVIEFKNF